MALNIEKSLNTQLREFNERPSTDNLMNRLTEYALEDKYLYHYTLTDNLESIMADGLIPRRYPNSNYPKGANGIFLTTSDSLYDANLPESMMDLMSEYYDDEESYSEKPIVRLKIDITILNPNNFTWDDDYILNKYGWNKAETDVDKIVESLELWRSIAYLGNIPKEAILGYDFDYGN